MGRGGIHHLTAIAGPAGRNRAFYVETLGLRMVKQTVNFDDPSTYHLYYGDTLGSPGSIVTFFPWEHVAPGRHGIGSVDQIMLRVPEGALGWWLQRFVEKAVAHEQPVRRFDETMVAFKDPDGLHLALAALPGIEHEAGWTEGGIDADHAIRGIHGISLLLESGEATGALLTDVLGFEAIATEENRSRFRAPDTPIGGIVDIEVNPARPHAHMGGGSVHHVAFRAADDQAQAAMAAKLTRNHRITPTEQKDRTYFRSIYFQTPGQIIFEIATDGPGFAIDEPVDALGSSLRLPQFLESRRAGIEAGLPDLADEVRFRP